MILRIIEKEIPKYFFRGKAILVYGPRQAGKTTSCLKILQNTGEKFLHLNGDEPDIRLLLENAGSAKLRAISAGYRFVFIDEAQKIADIGNTLKLFTDVIPEVQVIASSSSAFELAQKSTEALTGRKYEFAMFPMMFRELMEHHGLLEEKRMLEQRLIFGSYPEVVSKPDEAYKLVKELTASYLFKDILTLDTIKYSHLIDKLVRALALQVGSEVSFTELASTIGADIGTVEKYINILEKAFIVFRLPSLSGNARTEIIKGKKFYFYDNGIRNAVIGNLNQIISRNDIGALWENYILSERIKILRASNSYISSFFWRTTQQQEIDYIEENEGKLYAWELKWNPNKKAKYSKTFTENYKPAETSVINRENYESFLLKEPEH